MTTIPAEFVRNWSESKLREQQAAQSHFIALCQLVGHKTPTQLDPEGTFFTFEEQLQKTTGGKGRADVWYKGHFAWEYKGKHKDLDAAYAQLLAYKTALENPPLLVVCDFLEYRIYPQWPNINAQPFKFTNNDLLDAKTRNYIVWLLESPEKFKEERQSELNQRAVITRDLADQFAHLADLMRRFGVEQEGKAKWTPMQIAQFLAKLTFALFAEDTELLPRVYGQPVFRFLVDGGREMPQEFVPQLETLFQAMAGEKEAFNMKRVPYFNGGLFEDSSEGAGDGTEALDLAAIPGALDVLGKASEADWRKVNPTIFGTLFEGALDISKRAQLGAHYTSEADIRLIVEPVLMQPLYRLWDEIRTEAEPLLQTYLQTELAKLKQNTQDQLIALHDRMMDRLGTTKVLDPACGSGNFLYVSLRAMKDLEARVRKTFEPLGLPFRDVVTPRQLYGIEKDEFAAKLAQIVVWIGYLQWRYEDEGILRPFVKTSSPHPRALSNPVLKDKDNPTEPDRIVCDDSILRYDAEGKPYEPEWPAVDVIMGNPPFLGGNRVRGELGDSYINSLFALYKDRVPAFADLVCYWFEKARVNLENGAAKRIGLIATNSIRGGTNRTVLDRIKQTGDIFMAWSDRSWLLAGASVRVSIIGFDNGLQTERILDSMPVVNITSDLQSIVDLTQAQHILENESISFQGPSPKGSFDIPNSTAKNMLDDATNLDKKNNSDVVKPVLNAFDITHRSRDIWTIDFGLYMLEQEATLYRQPFDWVKQHVYPERITNNRKIYREKWWLYAEPRVGMREALHKLTRYIATPRHAKYRLFVWVNPHILCNDAVIAIARDDDYFFGVLHAYAHELWSLRMGTWLGKGNDPRYTPTTTFETYPFPWSPRSEPTTDPAYLAISAAARALNAEREAWLNPSEFATLSAPASGTTVKDRTLTNLYNALQAYRGVAPKKPSKTDTIKAAAREFAPRLAALHASLDQAVLAAYGWSDLVGTLRTSEGDEELLRRLLALNLARATA
ncbi:MAG: DNA methyltransferase [Chloroflexota bacterium]